MSSPDIAQVNTPTLNEEKARLFNKMERTNDAMYITGRAGSGKSFLLDFFAKHTHKNIAIVAPTGVAALNVNGQTIHSFFSLDIGVQNIYEIRRKGVWGKCKEILKRLDTIVIDEASMVRADVMDAIDVKLRIANENDLPFGGKQIILFGDLYQLPPVVEPQVNRYLTDTYGDVFFFNAPVFDVISLYVYELKTVFRQKDDAAFVAILNDIRVGNVTDNELDVLNEYSGTTPRDSHNLSVVLSPRNEAVARINQEKLDQINRPEYMYKAEITGDFSQSSYPTEVELCLKVGAQVMMLKNDTCSDGTNFGDNRGRRWVNGTMGVVSELTPNTIKVMINKVEHSIDRVTWERKVYEYDASEKKLAARPVATFKQFPIRLAWALTIHKAQGQTYQSVEVDLEGGVFSAGQTYVALSRCVAMNKLYLTRPISREDIIVNQAVASFMDKHRDSDEELDRIDLISDKEQRRAELLRQLAALDTES